MQPTVCIYWANIPGSNHHNLNPPMRFRIVLTKHPGAVSLAKSDPNHQRYTSLVCTYLHDLSLCCPRASSSVLPSVVDLLQLPPLLAVVSPTYQEYKGTLRPSLLPRWLPSGRSVGSQTVAQPHSGHPPPGHIKDLHLIVPLLVVSASLLSSKTWFSMPASSI